MYEPIYYTATSLLIFTRSRKLKRLKCPFRVTAIQDEGDFQKDAIYFVQKVYPSEDHRLLYEIDGQTYPYNTFEILLLEDLRT